MRTFINMKSTPEEKAEAAKSDLKLVQEALEALVSVGSDIQKIPSITQLGVRQEKYFSPIFELDLGILNFEAGKEYLENIVDNLPLGHYTDEWTDVINIVQQIFLLFDFESYDPMTKKSSKDFLFDVLQRLSTKSLKLNGTTNEQMINFIMHLNQGESVDDVQLPLTIDNHHKDSTSGKMKRGKKGRKKFNKAKQREPSADEKERAEKMAEQLIANESNENLQEKKKKKRKKKKKKNEKKANIEEQNLMKAEDSLSKAREMEDLRREQLITQMKSMSSEKAKLARQWKYEQEQKEMERVQMREEDEHMQGIVKEERKERSQRNDMAMKLQRMFRKRKEAQELEEQSRNELATKLQGMFRNRKQIRNSNLQEEEEEEEREGEDKWNNNGLKLEERLEENQDLTPKKHFVFNEKHKGTLNQVPPSALIHNLMSRSNQLTNVDELREFIGVLNRRLNDLITTKPLRSKDDALLEAAKYVVTNAMHTSFNDHMQSKMKLNLNHIFEKTETGKLIFSRNSELFSKAEFYNGIIGYLDKIPYVTGSEFSDGGQYTIFYNGQKSP
eukprot:g3641.t1